MTNTTLNNNNHLQPVKDAVHKEDIKSDLRKLKNHLREDVSELTQDVREYAASKADVTLDDLYTRLHELKQKGKSELSHLERVISERPTRSVAIAFLAGAVMSALFGRR